MGNFKKKSLGVLLVFSMVLGISFSFNIAKAEARQDITAEGSLPKCYTYPESTVGRCVEAIAGGDICMELGVTGPFCAGTIY